jgi:subtilase family serine protease
MPSHWTRAAGGADPALPRVPGRARRRRMGLAALPALAAFSLLGLQVCAAPASVAHFAREAHVAAPVPDLSGLLTRAGQFRKPLSTTQCQAELHLNCYTPVQYHVAYDLNRLYRQGITGAGQTILVVDSYGSPAIRHDVATFDRQFGLPPVNLTIDRFGAIPPYDPANSTMVGWAVETTLDVEYSHAIAPAARIVLAETPVAEEEGTSGFPQMMTAEARLINQGVPDVISQSFGATENTFPGFSSGNYSSLKDLRYAFEDAYWHHVTVLAAAGDYGATNYESNVSTLYPYRVDSWPSTDPLVTSVGGSELTLSNDGNRLAPDTVWNDGFGAGGGGVSAVFRRPFFQNGVAGVVGDHRGTPDISMSAAVNGGCWIYVSFAPIGSSWGIEGGTSEATPMFAGVVALADQLAGHRLGDINPELYRLGWLSRHGDPRTGIVDITTGNNSYAGVTGYTAGPGYDLASGWGTVDAYQFVHALARLGGYRRFG